ncbi:MAG TPA: ABC transporter permease [Solirubrobacteraceae bacterium]|jgi:ABC-2 type transport system permease protein
MVPAFLIARKDLRQRLRDRSALLVVIVIPFALAAILGATLSGTSPGSTRFSFATVTGDRGRPAQAFSALLVRLEHDGLLRLRSVDTLAGARRLAKSGEVAAAFYIAPGFSRAVGSGQGGTVEVVGDPNQPIGTLVARSIAQGYASELDGIGVAVATAIASGASATPSQLAAASARIPSQISIRDISARRRDLDAKTFYAAGMAVFFLFFTVQFGISTLLDERRDGTLARLQVAPVARTSILAGKVLTSVVLGVLGMSVLALASSLLLGAHWGNPLGVAILILTGVLAATSIMALVVTLARTPDQAGYWQAIVALVLGMLGGTFFPVYQAGGLISKLSLATPHAWFLRGLRELAGGAPASAALGPAAVILGFAVICGALTLTNTARLLRP